jgi:hypothetical protein
MAAPTAPGTLAGALSADVSVINFDARPGRAELVAAVALNHRLHQLVLNSPRGIGRDAKSPTQLNIGQTLLALGQQVHGAEPHTHRQLGALEDGPGDQRCLIATTPALEQLTLADLGILCCRAPRTLEAFRPTPSEPRPPAGLFVGIALLERVVREALLVLHAVARHRF